MVFQSDFNQKIFRRWGAILGSSLFGLAMTPLAATAAPGNQQNPCPGIYYEEPYNSTRLVPLGCPPNAATRLLIEQGRISGSQYRSSGSQVNVIQNPSPGTRQNVIATINPVDGRVTVQLKNDTNAQIFYQAVGYTDRRLLAGGNEITLQNLPTPVTITMTREDGGLLEVTPATNEQLGTLSISLDETTNFDVSRGTLRIQRNGQVFVN